VETPYDFPNQFATCFKNLQMNNVVSTNAVAFVLFVRFLLQPNCPFISLALKYFQIKKYFCQR